MAPELEVHPVQAQILKVLLFQPTARFSDLNTPGISSDHFTFHVKRLVELQLIEKDDDGYRLTTAGKEFANRFDVEETMKIERQAKLSVQICPVTEERGKKKYLLEQRLKQPYYGVYGFLGGKIKWGETVYEAAARELKEETNLAADLTLVHVHHKMDYSADNELLEDKYFFLLRAQRPRGKLMESYEGGKNIWLTKKEILGLPALFPDVPYGIEALEQAQPTFSEKNYSAEGY